MKFFPEEIEIDIVPTQGILLKDVVEGVELGHIVVNVHGTC